MQKWLIILPQKGDTRRLALAAPKPDCEVTEFSWRAFVNNAGGMSVMWRGGQGGGAGADDGGIGPRTAGALHHRDTRKLPDTAGG